MDPHNFRITFYVVGIAFMLILKINSIYSARPHLLPYDEATFPTKYFTKFPYKRTTWNTFSAPYALKFTIFAASFIARRETKRQIEKVLLLDEKQPPEWEEFITHLKDENGWNVRVYQNEKMKIAECVQERISEFLYPIKYAADKSYKSVNKWVRAKSKQIVSILPTRPQIKRLFNKNDLITVLNLNFMDTKWQKPFVNRYKKNITIVNGVALRGDMVQQENTFLYANLTDFGVQAIQLPLENGANMLILQPYNTSFLTENFKELKGKLQNFDIRKISGMLKETKLSVFFPELNATKSGRIITPTVKKLGIKRAFSEKDADFCKLTRCAEESYISAAHQNTFIHTNLTNFRIGTVTDLTWSIVVKKRQSDFYAYENEDDDEEDEPEDDEELSGEIENLSGLVLERFIYAIIQNQTTHYMGSLVKFHNYREIHFEYQ